jgi:hypothetical protein
MPLVSVNQTFWQIRQAQFKIWNQSMKWDNGWLWCDYQGQLLEKEKHSSYICSFTDQFSHVDDFLEDDKYDDIDASLWWDCNKNEERIMKFIRHYQRFLLVVSEIIVDYKKRNSITKKLQVKWLPSLEKVTGFINSYLKHKGENSCNIHHCNHHLIHHLDGIHQKDASANGVIDYTNYNKDRIGADIAILYPSINELITWIIDVDQKCREELEKIIIKEWIGSAVEKISPLKDIKDIPYFSDSL